MEEVCNVKSETVTDATDVNTFLCQAAGLCVACAYGTYVCVLAFTH